MYRNFDVLMIETSLKDKKVYVECTLDVEETSVTPTNIALIEKSTNRVINTKITVIEKIIELDLEEWPKPNSEYVIIIQTGIKSITDESLSSAIRRSIVFKSEITSIITIISPSDYEEIDDINIEWQEEATKETELTNSYYIEIASENAFYNIVLATKVFNKNKIVLTTIPAGQYYIRIRAEKDNEYGQWSETVTFLIKQQKEIVDPSTEYEPIYEKKLEIINSPQNGETPSSFLIEFDENIDIDGIEIGIIRKRY